MTDIMLSTDFAMAPSTKKLIHRLGPAAAWHLVCLFVWAAEHCPDGDLSGFTAEDIEIAVDWPGRPDVFYDQLQSTGFITGAQLCMRFWKPSRAKRIGRAVAKGWAQLRLWIFERDGWKCTYCGDSHGPFECDHVVPVSRGGSDDPSNLTTACKPCNRSKMAKLLSEWMPYYGR